MKAVIVITAKGKRSVQKLHDEEAKELFLMAQRRFPDHKVFLVELTHPEYEVNTEYNPRHPNILWCPYCGEKRKFFSDDQGGLTCPVCHISDRNFHTRACNRLFEEAEGDLKGGKKEKLERSKKRRSKEK